MTKHSVLDQLLVYLREVITWRIKNNDADFSALAPKLDIQQLGESVVTTAIKKYKLSEKEVLMLLLVLTPHLNPGFLLNVIAEEFPGGSNFPLFGGVKGKNHRGILPTGETVLFLLAGTNMNQRIKTMDMFLETHQFYKKQILYLESVPNGEPIMSGKLNLYPDAFYALTSGVIPSPKMNSEFPAEKLQTQLEWEDLVLNKKTLQHIKDLEVWLKYNPKLMEEWGMKSRIKEGYRVLFHGPPGTGKTLTAALLGKHTNKPVYRIDLSVVVSKYIGETEKNLSNLFDNATNKDWILFFDEADAIFGKRTNVRNAHDQYANQEVSYLLQRIESHSGLVILASNCIDTFDEAFTRRFQAIVSFELPGSKERKLIWEQNFPKKLKISKEIDIEEISKKYELSGSNILNIIHYCSLKVLSLKTKELTPAILIEGIRKEYHKEDRLF